VEAEDKPEIIDKKEPVRIIAKKPGIIESVFSSYGTPKVKAGDRVTQGQTLISEEVLQQSGEIKKVHAQGSVIAKVQYSEEYNLDIKPMLMVRTGNSITRRYIILGNQKMNIKNPSHNFATYETEIKTQPLVLNYSPIKAFAVTETIYETVPKLDEETVWTAGQEIAQEKLTAMLQKVPTGIEIVDKSVDLSIIKEGEIFIKATVITREEIALKQKAG
jgi:similar to stage IV sporulation protein